MTKVFLWSLTSYDRVVFLDPRSLIQKNPDALFACEGFCAAGAVYSPSSSPSFRPSWAREAQAAGSAAGSAPSSLAAAHDLEGGGGGSGGGEDDDDDDEEVAAAAAAVLEKPLSAPPSWQPSTSVMVLEPSLAVHAAMLDELTRTPAVGSLEAQVFLSSFLLEGATTDAGDRCTPFEDPVENASPDRHRSVGGGGGGMGLAGRGGWIDAGGGGGGGGFGGVGGGEENNEFGDGGGSFLEDALMPVVLLNGPHVPRCAAGRKRTAEGVCQRLPYTFAAPSTDFNGKGSWGAHSDQVMPEPHIVHFADEDAPWKRLAYLHKPLFWKWNAYRQQLDYPYGNFFAPWVLFFIPCVVLAFARVYYKTASGSGGDRNGRTCGGGGGSSGGGTDATAAFPQDDCSPSKRRAPWLRSPKQPAQRQQQQVAILPACGMAAAYDGAATAGVGSLEAAAARFRNSSCGGGGGSGGGLGIAVGADHSPSSVSGGRLPIRICYALSALVGGFGLLWFRAARALAREVVDPSWHPVISVSVHDAWLCCALVLGLYVMDYLYYALLTRGRTLLKDSVLIVVLVTVVRVLYSMTAEGGSGCSGCGAGVVWAGAIGIGVIALGFGHGSRAGIVHHLSGRAQFRCVVASCLVGTFVSLAMCWAGPKAHQMASRRTQSAAATAQMVFVALVYASVIGGARLRSDMDEAGSKISRSCSTASFVSDAFIAAAASATTGTGMASSVSSTALLAQESRASAKIGAATVAIDGHSSGGGGSGGGEGWRAAWSLLTKAARWTKDVVWQRRRVAVCIMVLGLWKVSSSIARPTNPSRFFEKYGQSCLESQAGYVEAGGKRLSRVCGAEQALRPVATGAYFEAFRQDKVCLEVAGGGFLTLGRVHVAQACLPENQFVFQQVTSTKPPSSKSKGGGGGSAASKTTGDGEYCVYNPTSGFYLSSQGRPRAQCGSMEHWRVKPAPRAPGLKGTGGGSGSGPKTSSTAKSMIAVLLHPGFLSRGPLRTFYGYLLAATALLVARAVFSKLATSPCVASARRGGGGSGNSGGVSKHHRGLGARQRSRGRTHSRSNNSIGNLAIDTGYIGDAGYAGDAETGAAGCGGGYLGGGGDCSSSSSSSRVRSLGSLSASVSPVAAGGQHRENLGWSNGVMLVANRSDERRLTADGRSTRHHLKREMSSGATTTAAAAAASAGLAPGAPPGSSRASCGDGWLVKLFSGLVVVCDATLLAGLWCLVPAHLAQAMSALTRDHRSAIDQGLGMDSNNNVAAMEDDIWSRSLGEGLNPLAEYTIVNGVGGAGEAVSASAFSCDSGAWWLMSALVRWHLLFLLVAFCHLHGAVNAASSATNSQRWRNRRSSKKTTPHTVGDHHRRSSGSFWGLWSGERLAMRLRTALGVLTLLCAAAATVGPELGERSDLLFAGLHGHRGWGRCAPAAGLDESWGVVSPLLVFAMLAATGGVYVRAGSSFSVRCGAGVALLAAGAAFAAAGGWEYLILAVAALAMDWLSWVVAGVMSCVCYKSEGVDDVDGGGLPVVSCCATAAAAPRLVKRHSSGSTDFFRERTDCEDQRRAGSRASTATGGVSGGGARHRISDAARRVSPRRWVVGFRGRKGEPAAQGRQTANN